MVKIHAFCQFQHNFTCSEGLCKLSKEYLNPMTSFIFFSGQNYETFDISHAFSPLTVAKLSTLKNSPLFDPPFTNVFALFL